MLTQVLDLGTYTVGPLSPGDGEGEVVGPTWLGDGPTIELELVGIPGMRAGVAEA